jgi:hypothetical protein
VAVVEMGVEVGVVEGKSLLFLNLCENDANGEYSGGD